MQSFVEFGPVCLEKKLLKCRPCFFAILLLSPFGKGCDPSGEETKKNSFTQDCCVQSLNKIYPVVLEKNVNDNSRDVDKDNKIAVQPIKLMIFK